MSTRRTPELPTVLRPMLAAGLVLASVAVGLSGDAGPVHGLIAGAGLLLALGLLAPRGRDDPPLCDAEHALQLFAAGETWRGALFDGAADAMLATDVEGRVLEANRACKQMFDQRTRLLRAMRIVDLVSADARPQVQSTLDTLPPDETAVMEAEAVLRDLERLPVDLAAKRIELGGRPALCWTVRDLTLQKELEQLKNHFVSVVSHELRTPLTSIRGALGLLTGGVAGELPPQVAQLLAVACKNSERLIALINDILDMQKIESGNLVFDLATHDLAELIREGVQLNEGYGATHGVRFVVAGLATGAQVQVDANRLLQVLSNLISNAVKYSDEGGAVELTLTCQGEVARVGVTDHGPGIPVAFRPRVFSQFAQADAGQERKTAGTGLGLSISKAIVDRLGGQMGFDTTEGVGTTFWFELPLLDMPRAVAPAQAGASATADEDASAATGALPAAAARPRILYVEDDGDLRHIIGTTLEAVGDVTTAGGVGRARELLACETFDLILLDLQLPDGMGPDVIAEFGVGDTPVVVFSVDQPDAELTSRISASVVKTRTSNDELLNVIRSSIASAARERSNE